MVSLSKVKGAVGDEDVLCFILINCCTDICDTLGPITNPRLAVWSPDDLWENIETYDAARDSRLREKAKRKVYALPSPQSQW